MAPWTIAQQAPLSMGFSGYEHCSGLPCPSPGDLPNSGIEPRSPHCRWILYYLSHQGSPCVCVCVYTLSHEKEWDNAIWSSMDEPRDDRGKWSQTKANTIWYHLYVECKKINEIIYKTEQTHRHRMQTYGYQRGKRREEVNEDFGINIDKLLYIK